MSDPNPKIAPIVAVIHPRLKAMGFVKQRLCFNRRCQPDLVQVLQLQMYSLGTKFAAEVAFHVPAVDELLNPPGVRSRFVSSPDCVFRARMNELRFGEEWVDLERGSDRALREFLPTFELAVELLDRVICARALADEIGAARHPLNDGQVGPLCRALLLLHLEHTEEARALLRAYDAHLHEQYKYRREPHPHHVRFRELMKQLDVPM